jgi:hypothetical protein
MKKFTPDRLRKLAWSLLAVAILVSLLVFATNMRVIDSGGAATGLEINEPNSEIGMLIIFMGVFSCIGLSRDAHRLEKIQKDS